MKELEEIKSRIQNRRNCSKEVDVEIIEYEKKYTKPSKFYKISMFCLMAMFLFLSVAVYAKKDENGKFLRDNLGIDVNFTSFNKTMNKLINFRSIENIANGDLAVSNVPSYIHLGEDLYVSDGSEVKSIDDGVVTYIYNDENGYLVIIENDSGFRSTYMNLTDVSVKINDRVYFDSVLGVVEDNVKILFSKDNKKITYEQVLGII